jgi:hypothetical protein
MGQQPKRLLWALFISLVLVLFFGGISDLTPAFTYLGFITAPGMFGAAIFFPQGVHGGWPEIYLAVALIIDVALYTWPVLLVWRLLHLTHHGFATGSVRLRLARGGSTYRC